MLSTVKRFPLVFLITILALFVSSFYLRLQFDFNAGHMDEYDYLFVGKHLLAGGTWPSHNYIFGSDVNWYLLGLGEQTFNGLEGARIVAGGFGLLSLLGIYWFVFSLWERHLTAFIATFLLSTQSVQLFISRFATYDVISFACFTLALAPLIFACTKQERIKYAYLALAVLLMGLAILSKYVVILYLPVLAGIAFLHSRKIGLIFGAGVGGILLAYGYLHWDALLVLYQDQLQGVHGVGNSSAVFIIDIVFRYLAILLIIGLLAVLWSLQVGPKPFWKHSLFQKLPLLFLCAFPIIVYHLNALNMIALVKHLVYAALFLVPIAAWILTNLVELPNSRFAQPLAIFVVVGMCMTNYEQLRALEQAYPDVTSVVEYAEKKLDANDTILSEDPYLFRYLGATSIPQAQIKESGWLDNNHDGKHEHQDVIDAVWDRKFAFVFLNDQLHPELNKKLRRILKSRSYDLVISKEYGTSDVMSQHTKGFLSLYKRSNGNNLSFNTGLQSW